MNKNPIIVMLLILISMMSLASCNLTDEASPAEPAVVTDTTSKVDTVVTDTTDSIPNAVCVLDSVSVSEMMDSASMTNYLNDTALAFITVWDSDSLIVKDTTIQANLYPTFNWLRVTLDTPCSNVMAAIDSLERNKEYIGTYTNRSGDTFRIEISLLLRESCGDYEQCESLFEIYYPKDPE